MPAYRRSFSDSDEDIRSHMSKLLKKRANLSAVRLELSRKIGRDFLKLLKTEGAAALFFPWSRAATYRALLAKWGKGWWLSTIWGDSTGRMRAL